VTIAAENGDKVGMERFSVSIPSPQNDALDAIARQTGLSKNELIRHALAILTTSMEAKKKGLDLALSRDDTFVGRIISAI
jgi:HPt (histidine-containing phosphotransfer) domain-containing protein